MKIHYLDLCPWGMYDAWGFTQSDLPSPAVTNICQVSTTTATNYNHHVPVWPNKTQRKVKDKANPRDATPEKQPAETLEVSRRLENQGTYGVYN